MATQVPIPKLGQSEETVSIVKWHKAEGDVVAKGDVLFEVETDKAVLEVESQFEGTLLKVLIPAGQEVPVMTTAAVLGEPGEPIPEIKPPAAVAAAPVSPAPTSAAATTPAPPAPPVQARPAPSPPAQPAPTTLSPVVPTAPVAASRRAVSPRARSFAADYLIDLGQVAGTGPGGRVVEGDVKTYLESSGYLARKITPAAENLARTLGINLLDLTPTGMTGRITVADVRRVDAERPVAMSKMRQLIARRLQQSKQTVPHFYATVSVDMTELSALRKRAKEQGFALSFNDFVVKACALALREFPAVNSSTDDGRHVRWHSAVNVGVAVSVDNGLVVPVLPNTDKMPLDEMHAAAKDFADRARDGRLLPDEMKGGTFTVSNMGMLNVENFGAIINPGESAILAIGSIAPAAVVDDGRQVVVRDMMKITLSADHRIVDGALAALFVNAVKRRLESVGFWVDELGLSRPVA